MYFKKSRILLGIFIVIHYLGMMEDISPVLRPGDAKYGANTTILGRWSSRAIDSDRGLSMDVMNRIFEAGRWAPSAFNNQPWRFLSFGPEDKNALDKARKTLMENNRWALAAPRLIFALCRTDLASGKGENNLAAYETGMSVVQMALQAAEEGLVFHQMKGYKRSVLKKTFSIPDNFQPLAAIALGWPGSNDNLPQPVREMEFGARNRKDHSDFIFSNGSVPEQ